MKQEKWAERLENHLKNYREEPQRDLWEGIEAALDKKASQHARVVSLRRWMVAASLVGVLAGGAYLFWNHSEPDDTIAPSIASISRGICPERHHRASHNNRRQLAHYY